MAIEEIAQNALKALLYEVVTNPKPGLVDPADVGSHPDMNVYMFIDSSLSLENILFKPLRLVLTLLDKI